MGLLIALAVLVATLLQTGLSVRETARARLDARDTWLTEGDLAAEVPWWRRPKALRELRSMRDDEESREIRHLQLTMISWMILVFASAVAVGDQAYAIWG